MAGCSGWLEQVAASIWMALSRVEDASTETQHPVCSPWFQLLIGRGCGVKITRGLEPTSLCNTRSLLTPNRTSS